MNYKRVHFIGIGGIGMSGIACILQNKGIVVSGSDIKQSHILDLLRERGINVYLNHRPENIQDADLVVYSSAIESDNLEFREARKRNIPLIKRAECLAELMKDKISITISGAHGKTTTTSLAAHMLINAGFMPTAVIGGIVRDWDNNIWIGKSDYFVAEADESDGTFLKYNPNYSIITNIDYEHLDYYQDYSKIIEAFSLFMDNTKDKGCLIACGDDSNIRRILVKYKKPHATFGLSSNCDITVSRLSQNGYSSQFDCRYHNKLIGRFNLSLPGLHNVLNALSVIALGIKLGIDKDNIYESLASYKGTERRFEIKAKTDKYLIIDDYAHHPTEIKATLSTARQLLDNESSYSTDYNYKRIIAIFQPHRYSRTKFLLDKFVNSFNQADYLVITDIYEANETPIEGISAKLLHDKIKQNGRKNVEFVKKDEIVKRILDISSCGDLIITLGAGDIGKLTDELSCRLIKKN